MKAADFFSERMIFGMLIITGLNGLLFELISLGPNLPPEIITLAAGGMGALSASVGIIVQAIWKTDKADKQAAETAAVLAAKAPDQSGTAIVQPVTIQQPPGDPVPVTDAGPTGP
jgi:hypothetical protein